MAIEESSGRMPVIFSGHGSPMNAIGDNRARDGWKKMGKHLGKPNVIVAVSAHWATHGTCVRTSADDPQIFDMYGFPDELYKVHYEPDGSPEYAGRVLELLGDDAREDNSWGIDHGVWSIICNMYPDGDVPVVMVSTDVTASPERLYSLGKKIAPLRDEGAMIMASGNIVHNLGMVDWSMDDGFEWANVFDREIRDAVTAGNFAAATEYEKLPYARAAVPTVEHYYPFLAALGAASENNRVTVWNEYRELGSMSMTSYLFEAE